METTIRNGEDENTTKTNQLLNIFSFVSSQNGVDKIFDLPNNKFTYLSEFATTKNLITGIFSSAKNNHCPPLIDKSTAGVRSSDKKLSEGEKENSHFLIKLDTNNDEITLILEERRSGVTTGQICRYLTCFMNKMGIAGTISNLIIPKEDFMKEFEKLRDIKVAELHISQKKIGGESLNFANLDQNMRETVVLQYKAERKKRH